MAFALQRLFSAVVVLLLVSIAVFLLMRVVPGDPAQLVAGPLASEDAVERMRVQMGLHLSIPEQYFTYVSGLLSGDWGTAWHTRQSVSEVLLLRLPASLELAIVAILIAISFGIPTGATAAYKAGGPTDHALRTISLIALGTPAFWLGLVLILIGFSWLELAPAPFERLTPGVTPPPHVTGFLILDSLLAGDSRALSDATAHLVLPALTLALPLTAWLALITRRSVLDVYGTEYIRTARAKGVSERSVLYRHALPNAMLPILTLASLALGDLVAGALMVETVFAWPGIGGFVTESIIAQDFAPVQAVIILGAVGYSILNVITDLLYGSIDPRVRLGG
jgi:peptide/nickel transport system permease protein